MPPSPVEIVFVAANDQILSADGYRKIDGNWLIVHSHVSVPVDLATGKLLHWMRLGGVVRELYDIAILPSARRPMLVGLAQGQVNRLINRGAPLPLAELIGDPK